MNALFLNLIPRGHTVPRTKKEGENQIAQGDGLVLYKRGYLVWGPYFMQGSVGTTICPCQSRRNNKFASLPQQFSALKFGIQKAKGAGVSRNIYVP